MTKLMIYFAAMLCYYDQQKAVGISGPIPKEFKTMIREHKISFSLSLYSAVLARTMSGEVALDLSQFF